MMQDDLAKENAAIKQYKEHIKLAIEENDPRPDSCLRRYSQMKKVMPISGKPHSQ